MGRGQRSGRASSGAYQTNPRTMARSGQLESGFAQLPEVEETPPKQTQPDRICPVCGRPLSQHSDLCSAAVCPSCGQAAPDHNQGCHFGQDKYRHPSQDYKTRLHQDRQSALNDLPDNYINKNRKR